MIKSKQKLSLADKIADILTTAPTHFDPEDEPDPETSAKLTYDAANEEEDQVEEEILSKFRKQNIDLLADIDERYAGKKASRKRVQESDEEIEELPSDSEVENSEDENDNDEDIGANEEEETDEAEEGEEEEEAEGEDSNDDGQDSETPGEEYEDTDSNFKHMSSTDVSTQVKKGVCVRNQINMWENLLEMRIQLQKCLVSANKMPPHDKYKEIKKEMGNEYAEKISETKKNVATLLDKLLILQNLVQKKYPETKKLGKTDDKKTEEEGDEEIPSDTDEEEVLSEDNEDEEDKVPTKRRKLIPEYEKEISENFNVYKPYRNNVIQKWHDKTRLTFMKSNAASHSIVEHIEHTLSDRAKLTKRTQLRRSDYEIIGEKLEDQKQENEQNNSRISQLYNAEIFDDDDFYHQLLRELIEMRSADLTDPVQLGKQWSQLQNLRSKMKRKIDTKATKGRKIRYTVHTKLVNFMAPIDECNWTDEAKNELYSSLFGKKQLNS